MHANETMTTLFRLRTEHPPRVAVGIVDNIQQPRHEVDGVSDVKVFQMDVVHLALLQEDPVVLHVKLYSIRSNSQSIQYIKVQ